MLIFQVIRDLLRLSSKSEIWLMSKCYLVQDRLMSKYQGILLCLPSLLVADDDAVVVEYVVAGSFE